MKDKKQILINETSVSFYQFNKYLNLQDFLQSISSQKIKCSKEQIFGIIFSIIDILIFLQIHKKIMFDFNLENIIQISDTKYVLSLDKLKEFQKQGEESINIDCIYEKNKLADFLYFVLDIIQEQLQYEDQEIKSIKNAINQFNLNQQEQFREQDFKQKAIYFKHMKIQGMFDNHLVDLILLLCQLLENLTQNKDFFNFIQKYLLNKYFQDSLLLSDDRNCQQNKQIFLVLVKNITYQNICQGCQYDESLLNQIEKLIEEKYSLAQKELMFEYVQDLRNLLYQPIDFVEKLVISIDENKQQIGVNYVQDLVSVLDYIRYEYLHLGLRINKLGDQEWEIISNAFNKNKAIIELNITLCQNQIGFHSIIKGIEESRNIKQLSLNLGEKGIDFQGLARVVLVIQQNKSLEILDLNLRQNNIDQLGASIIGCIIYQGYLIKNFSIDLR
ncbi:hypothetical protein ABPG72_022157 [Tetrahymena utriculariae]